MPRQYFQEKYQMELLETIHTHTQTYIFMIETEHDIGGFDSNQKQLKNKLFKYRLIQKNVKYRNRGAKYENDVSYGDKNNHFEMHLFRLLKEKNREKKWQDN